MLIRKRNLLYLPLLFLSFLLQGQQLNSSFTAVKIEKGKTYCDNLDLKKVNVEKTFLFCKDIYSLKKNYREALNVMRIGEKKFPYSYEIRLQKAIALKQMGNTMESTRELTGLLHLYPDKFELHNFLARIQYDEDRVKALMPFIVSVVLEPNNPVASENLIFIRRLLNVKSLPMEATVKNSAPLQKTEENDFELVTYVLTHDNTGLNESSERDYLNKRLSIFIHALGNTPTRKSGFFWEFYGNYFNEINEKHLTETLTDRMLNHNPTAATARLLEIKLKNRFR